MTDWQLQPDDGDEDLSAGFSLLRALSSWSLVQRIGDGAWIARGPLAGNSGPGVAESLTQQQIPEDGVTRDCHRDWS